MSIRFSCPNCNKPLAVADDKAGLRVACPGCKHPLQVPASGHAAGRAGGPHALSDWGQVDAVLGGAVEVIDRPLTAQEDGQVRAALTAYANTAPHHGIAALGKKVTITGVRELRVHHVQLESLFEKRHAARKSEPFQGSTLPAPTVTEANVRVWGYPYPTGKEFRSGSVEHRVEESRQQAPCTPCGGRGTVACPACSASGRVACSACSGSGRLKCGQCGGAGQSQVRVGSNQKRKKCTSCYGEGGNGVTRCMTCDGSGIEFYDDPIYQVVACQCSNGLVGCPTCGGDGRVRCPTCQFAGKLPCSACKATGKLISYLVVVQTFEPNTQTATVPCTALKDAAIAGMVQPSDYSSFLTLAANSHPPALNLTSGVEKLRAAITRAFDAALARVSDEYRLTRQRLQVGVASVLEVGYEYEGEAYTAWLVGKQHRVHAPVSPVTDALQEMVKEAVRTWKKGDQKEATVQLRKVMDMAKADAACQRAYDEVRDTIPTDLESKARWVRWKPFIIAAAVIFGIVFLIGLIGVGYALFRAKSGPSNTPPPPPFMGGPERPGGPGGAVTPFPK